MEKNVVEGDGQCETELVKIFLVTQGLVRFSGARLLSQCVRGSKLPIVSNIINRGWSSTQ